MPVDYKIHCHCFTSNYDSALKWTSRFENLFIGLTPLVTYRSAVDTHEVARLLPLDKLLLETDAPYFLPCGFDVSDMTVCDMMVHDMTVGNVETDPCTSCLVALMWVT